MVVHQAVRETAPSLRPYDLAEHPEVDMPVKWIAIDGQATIAARVNVVLAAFDVLARLPRHVRKKPGVEKVALLGT
jgi:hypothetical protein